MSMQNERRPVIDRQQTAGCETQDVQDNKTVTGTTGVTIHNGNNGGEAQGSGLQLWPTNRRLNRAMIPWSPVFRVESGSAMRTLPSELNLCRRNDLKENRRLIVLPSPSPRPLLRSKTASGDSQRYPLIDDCGRLWLSKSVSDSGTVMSEGDVNRNDPNLNTLPLLDSGLCKLCVTDGRKCAFGVVERGRKGVTESPGTRVSG